MGKNKINRVLDLAKQISYNNKRHEGEYRGVAQLVE